MNQSHVLIVDDDPALLQALPEALRLRVSGITVDTCDSALAALNQIVTTDYDAIISDIKMPGMDGLKLLSKIRALRPSTPTLLITGHGEHDLAVQALRGGAYDFVQKPIDREYFVASLNRAIQMRHLSRQVEEQQLALLRHANELEQTVEERTHELREANRAKDEFLATLSHELRTPLNAILGWAQLLRTRKFDEATTARAIETIERNAKSQTKLIEDILDVSRIITGKLRLDVRPVSLIPAIEAAVSAVRPGADAKTIQLKLILDPSVGSVLGDLDRLQQVVWNLLSNAIKFTPAGGRVEVRLSDSVVGETSTVSQSSVSFRPELKPKGSVESPNRSLEPSKPTTALPRHLCQIKVSDTGQGISADFLPYVFDRFRQAESSSTRSHGGLGLGLAIVRHLVELHGGTVHVESLGEGQGATFTVSFPLISAYLETSAQEQMTSITKSAAGLYNFRGLHGLRVLVVDDETDTRELLTTVLEQYGAKVMAVASVVEALEALGQNPLGWQPDVLVSDIGMLGEDGYALIRQVRTLEAEQGRQLPAAALTAYARDEDRKQALLAGFQMHIPKPVEPTELVTVVANLARQAGKI